MEDHHQSLNSTNNATKHEIIVYEIIYLSALEIFILVGNVLVILAFVTGPRTIRTYTNYFVVNLAVSDLMVGSLSVPCWILYKLGRIFITPFILFIFSTFSCSYDICRNDLNMSI